MSLLPVRTCLLDCPSVGDACEVTLMSSRLLALQRSLLGCSMSVVSLFSCALDWCVTGVWPVTTSKPGPAAGAHILAAPAAAVRPLAPCAGAGGAGRQPPQLGRPPDGWGTQRQCQWDRQWHAQLQHQRPQQPRPLRGFKVSPLCLLCLSCLLGLASVCACLHACPFSCMHVCLPA